MKAKKHVLIYLLIAAIAFTSFSFNKDIVYADVTVPDTIRIGIGFGQSRANIFTLASDSGVELLAYENNNSISLMEMDNPAGIRVRRDEYYKVLNGTESEINYVRAAQYEGEVIGPYHIQIGGIYPDMETAEQVQKRFSSIASSVFLAYEGGWRVWTQLYLDENECMKQIELMKKEIGDTEYSVVYPDRKRLQIVDNTTGQPVLLVNSEQKVKVSPVEKDGRMAAIQYKGKKYRGSMTMQSLAESDVTLINELPLDEYLYGVVASEMSPSWPLEALKAQAVAARSYALATIGRHSGYGFDLCSGEHCQVYKGMEQENSNIIEAVDATSGKILAYEGKVITAFFHSTSGGHTEDSENVWGTRTEYIRGVEDTYSLGSPYDNWTLELDKSEIKEKLAKANVDLGEIVDIRILEVSQFGRVLCLEVKGTKDTKVFEKEKIRTILGTTALKSIWYKLNTDADIFVSGSMLESAGQGRASSMYVVSAAGNTKIGSSARKISVKGISGTKAYNAVPGIYTFEGKGYGHGLGMSQYGAKGMAEAGNNYVEILEHYYKGAKVQ
ncbi:MAG TPA: SpoIID/LytB domain-containing protein [Clostridia bacterium]|nr:SpoIID/LytB domain-containing protein [Clostridia bacterium]